MVLGKKWVPRGRSGLERAQDRGDFIVAESIAVSRYGMMTILRRLD